MSVKVHVYVEGDGDRAELKGQCRKGFQKLLAKAGFKGRLPRVFPCGPRDRAFRSFQGALHKGDGYPILLGDSEDPVAGAHRAEADPSGAWRHLAERDDWARPSGAKGNQAQLMVTTMETWLLADRRTLINYFPDMNVNASTSDTRLRYLPKDL